MEFATELIGEAARRGAADRADKGAAAPGTIPKIFKTAYIFGWIPPSEDYDKGEPVLTDPGKKTRRRDNPNLQAFLAKDDTFFGLPFLGSGFVNEEVAVPQK